MKLEELYHYLTTYHFKVLVYGSDETFMAETMPVKYDNYEVLTIEATTEVSKESPITREIVIRPIIEVVIKEIK